MTIGIIGYGSFGMFVHELVRRFYPEAIVRVYARKGDANDLFRPLSEVAQCDMIFLSVPIRRYEEVLDQLVPLLKPDSVVVDVATVKEYTVGLLRRHDGLRYVATHPMFGPYSYEKKAHDLTGLRLVLTEHTLSETALDTLRHEVARLGLVLLETTPEAHDRMLAETLFLTHYVGQVVTKGGFQRTDIDTVSFGFLMDAVESVQHDTGLFKDVYAYNTYCRDVVERFDRAEREVHDLLARPISE